MSSSSLHHRWLDESSPAPTPAPDAVVVAWSTVYVTLITSFVIGLLLYALFVYLRTKHCKEDNLTVFEMRQGLLSHRSPAPYDTTSSSSSSSSATTTSSTCSFGWARAALSTSHQETLRCVGLDMYMFLRFLRLSFRTALVGSLLSCAVLIPIYATGSQEGADTEEFNIITLANIEAGSAKLWATSLCWSLFVAFILYELTAEWRDVYAPHRYDFLAHGDADTTNHEYRYAVCVECVPKSLRSNKALYEALDKLFPNAIHQVHVCLNTMSLDTLVQERATVIAKLEAAEAKRIVKPDSKVLMVKDTSSTATKSSSSSSGGCCSSAAPKVEAIPFFKQEIVRLNDEIDEARAALFRKATAATITTQDDGDGGVQGVVMGNSKDEELLVSSTEVQHKEDDDEDDCNATMSSTAFVTFTSLKTKLAAIQVNIGGKVDYMEITAAPEPRGVVWRNVVAPAKQQHRMTFVAGLFWTTGIIFWAVPVVFVTGLANLNSLLKSVGLGQLDEDSFYYGLIAGLLPVIFLQVLMLLIYMGLEATAMYVIRMKSLPEIDAYTFYWYMLYQFANLWLILIGGSAFNQLDAMIKDPGSIVKLMASAMPGASTLFLNMTILNGFVMSAFFLSNLAVWGRKVALSFVVPEDMKTQRMLDEDKKAEPLLWGKTLPPIVFILLVAFVYMPIVPLLEPFAAIFFGAYYVVWKHNCLHVYANESEGGGIIWEKLFGFIMVCLYTAELIVIAYLGIKEGVGPSVFCILALVATILVHMRLGRNIISPLQNLSYQVAADVDIKEGELSPMLADTVSVADSVEQQLYGQPILKRSTEERGPMPYRREDGLGDEEAPNNQDNEAKDVVSPTDSALSTEF